MSLRLVIEVGEPELKHWPCPFAGIAPKVRAWLRDSVTGATIELPAVQRLQTPYALRAAWEQGHYRVVFEGGEFTAAEEDVDLKQPATIDGEYGRRRLEGRSEPCAGGALQAE